MSWVDHSGTVCDTGYVSSDGKSGLWFAAGVAALHLAWAGPASAAEPGRRFDIEIRVLPGESKDVPVAFDVTQSFDPPAGDPTAPLVELPYVQFNVPTSVPNISSVAGRDASGVFALRVRDEGDGAERRRQWLPDRAVKGPVTLRYRVDIGPAGTPVGPAIDLRLQDGVASGAASVFVLRPTRGSYGFRWRWDLDAMSPDVTAMSSLDEPPDGPLQIEALDGVFFMIGRMGRYPASPRAGGAGFYGAWDSPTGFDVTALLSWAETLHTRMTALFRTKPASYRVFMRRNASNPGSGMGGFRSFVFTFGGDGKDDIEQLRFTLSHEMYHTFQPMMAGADGVLDSLSVSWFNEGTAVFYQRTLPFRYGLISRDAYVRDLNYYAARYYTNALGNLPNSAVPDGFWKDTRIRTLPYDRGLLYFVTVDAALRKASAGKRSLDDLILELRGRQDQGRTVTQADWEELIQRELGKAGVDALQAMLAGGAPVPASDALGPCFRRISKPMRRYDPGFDLDFPDGQPRIVRKLVAGSNAERAGVRNGDEILGSVGGDHLQGQQDGVLRLKVRRDGQERTFSYLPRGETVSVWQWEDTGLPAEACRR